MSMKSNNKENAALTCENNYGTNMSVKQELKHSTTENGNSQIIPNDHSSSASSPSQEDEDDVFEVKMRKNRRCSNNDDEIRKKKSSNDSDASSFLNSRTYSNSTLSLNKSSIFPTGKGRKKSSISMSLSRGGGSDGEDNVKITGYLEKRSKILGWKKYWFVLDGRLLAYYKSQSEYDSLSVCCGSINLGIASTVRPIQIRGCKGYPIQIVTRSQVYYLRSPDKQILEQWLLAIQEASSHTSKISLPVWADPGSQFFRYSFAASSQWSINTSTEDITESLSKLPPNFYLKGARPSRSPNNLQKCHSFASLQSPSLYSNMSTSYKDKLNNNSSMKKKKPSLEAEDVPKNTSTGVFALKEELTRKLSVGKPAESETVKPSLTKPKAKSELPFLVNPHQGEPHYYDEIVDFEAIYENCESNSSSGCNSARNSSGSGQINNDEEKHAQDSSKPDGLLQSNQIIPQDTGIYESVESVDDGNNNDNLTKEIKNKQNSDIRMSNGSSGRKSGQSTKSEVNKKSNSKDFSGCEWERSQSLSNPNTMSKDSASGSGPASQSPTDFADGRKLSMESESSSITNSKENIADGKLKKRKSKKPFGNFFHKMFHRDKNKKSKDKPGNQSLIITGPVDLRGLHSDSPLTRPTDLPIDEARKNSLSRSTSSGPSPGSKEGLDHAHVIDELKVKVERNHHVLPLTSVAGAILQRSSTFTSNTRPSIPKKPKTHENTVAKGISVTPTNETQSLPEDNDQLLAESVVHRRKNSQSEDFQQKLAKFNRLSERLSSTFVAALSSTPADSYPSVGAIGRSRSFKFQKGRTGESLPPLPPKMKNSSSSSAEKNCYDYPSNNRPVPPIKKVKGSKSCKSKEDLTISKSEKTPPLDSPDEPDSSTKSSFSVIRSLHKKNSAPDILLFPSSRSSSRDSELNSKEDVDRVFEEILCQAPPIPPKVKSNPNLGSPSLPQRSISPQIVIPEYEVPGSPKPVKVVAPEPASLIRENSPAKENQQPSKGNISVSKTLGVHTYANSTNTKPSSSPSVLVPTPKPQVVDDGSPIPNNSRTNDGTKSPKLEVDVGQKIPTTSPVDNVYQNMKFATVNTLVQEYETVEETEEDEIAEMYDDFPSEYSGGGSHTYESISPLPIQDKINGADHYPHDHDPTTVRHSGMDELQLFLNSETKSNVINTSSGEYDDPHHYDNDDDDVFRTNLNPADPTLSPIRTGAVSRLGHSSAVDQLKRMVTYAKSDL